MPTRGTIRKKQEDYIGINRSVDFMTDGRKTKQSPLPDSQRCRAILMPSGRRCSKKRADPAMYGIHTHGRTIDGALIKLDFELCGAHIFRVCDKVPSDG